MLERREQRGTQADAKESPGCATDTWRNRAYQDDQNFTPTLA